MSLCWLQDPYTRADRRLWPENSATLRLSPRTVELGAQLSLGIATRQDMQAARVTPTRPAQMARALGPFEAGPAPHWPGEAPRQPTIRFPLPAKEHP